MSKKYLILADSFLYFCSDPDVEFLLIPDKNNATQYTLDEAIAIKANPEYSEGIDIDFIPVDSLNPSFEIFVKPIDSDNLDFASYAQWTMKLWAANVSCFRDWLNAPENKEKLDQAIARMKAYIESEKQNKNYRFHSVTYVGFPLDCDYATHDFAPFFRLAINYGGRQSVFVNFLVK
jgi:hypothetical protein